MQKPRVFCDVLALGFAQGVLCGFWIPASTGMTSVRGDDEGFVMVSRWGSEKVCFMDSGFPRSRE